MLPETRAWAVLLTLSALSTGLALAGPGLSGWAVQAASAALLGLAWLKARVILGDYLGLSAAPTWQRGFNLVLGIYVLALFGLVLAA